MLEYVNLDTETRRWMLEELARDVSEGKLYLSPRLSPSGREDYPDLLKEAIQSHNDDWLAAQLGRPGLLNDTEQSHRGGRAFTKRVPVNAPETLAEGEFNRFYLRGLCRRAIEHRIGSVVVYRAKRVSQPRPDSERMVGAAIDPEALLRDLRATIGVDTAFGLPPGPNSGLSAKLPSDAGG